MLSQIRSRSWSWGLLLCFSALGLSTAGCASPGWLAWNGNGEQASPKLQLAWAMLQERDGKYGDARKAYTTVLEKDPQSVDAILGVARLDYLANRIPEAELGFQRAVQLAPQSPEALDALGQFYAEQERWDEASNTLQQAIVLAPDERIYRFHLAVATAKSGNIEGALPHFTQAVGVAEAHYNIGRILYDQGNAAAGEEHFALAVMQNPQLQEAQFWLDEVRNERRGVVVSANRPEAVEGVTRPSAPIAGQSPTQIAANPLAAKPANTRPAPQAAVSQSAAPTTNPPSSNWTSARQSPSHAGTVEQAGGFPAEDQLPFVPPVSGGPMPGGHAADGSGEMALPTLPPGARLSPAQQEQLENQQRRLREAANQR